MRGDRYAAYQDVGVRPAQTGRIDQAALREEVAGLQSTSRALDQITNYLFSDLAERAKVEGAEYGAANAPTEKQVQDAISAGRDPKELLGSNFTVFGKAARAQQLSALGIEVEMNARQALVDLRAKAKQYEVSPEEFLGGYDLPNGQRVAGARDVMDGFASSLAAISPILSRKFRAEMGQLSNAAYLETINDTLTREKQRRETVAQIALEGLMPAVRTIVGAGDTVGADGQVVTVDRKLDVLRDRVRSIALAANKPELVKDGLRRLEEELTTSRQNVVRGWFSAERDAYAAHRRLDAGDLPPAIASAYKGLTPEKQMELRDEARKLSNARFEDDDKVDAARRRERTRAGDSLFAGYVDALRAGDQTGAEAIMRQFRQIDPERYGTLVDRLPAAGAMDHPPTLQAARRLFAEEKLTRSWLENNAASLSANTISEFVGRLNTRNDARFREADAYIKRELAYPDRAIVNPSAADRRAIQIYNRTVNDLADAIRANPDLDVEGWVRAQTLTRRVESEAAAAKARAETAIRSFGDNFPLLKTKEAVRQELDRINAGQRGRTTNTREQLQRILDAYEEAGQ